MPSPLPPPRFIDQDSASPIPNFNTNSIVGASARLMFDLPVERADRIYLTLSSTVLGGEYNQSFDVAQDAPRQELLIPRGFVEASAGTIVSLLLQRRRGRLIIPAPTARVSINSRPIVVPAPSTDWNFDDGTFQGWVPQGNYVGGVVRARNQRLEIDLFNSQPGRSHVITRSVAVTPGRRYQCRFVVSTALPDGDGSRVYLTVDGVPAGRSRPVVPGGANVLGGEFTATSDRVFLGIFNESVPLGRHQLFLDSISLSESPAP